MEQKFNSTKKLTQSHKIILNAFKQIDKWQSFKQLIPNGPIELVNIDVENYSQYMRCHTKINKILETHGIQPHEIFRLINSYNGENNDFDAFKKLLMARNACIIKKIIMSDEWDKYIGELLDKIKEYTGNQTAPYASWQKILRIILIKLLMREIKSYDILQYKVLYDSKNNFKAINLSIEDQNDILKSLK